MIFTRVLSIGFTTDRMLSVCQCRSSLVSGTFQVEAYLLITLGLNFNCVEGVVPSCMSETNPAKYEPISCGDCKSDLLSRIEQPNSHIGCQLRFQLENDEMKKKDALAARAPSAVIVSA